MEDLPRHIAIIMDGNGRWATKRGLPRTAGHKAGAETFRRIATYCKNIGVQYLTVYAFSTENWKRSESEVSTIMLLLKRYLLEAVDTMERDHIRLHFFGDMTPIAPELRALAKETDEITEHLSKDDSRPTSASITAAGTRSCGRPGASPRTAQPESGSRRSWTEGLFSKLPGLRRHPGPGAHHPPQRGAAAQQFPALAVRLFGVLFTDVLWPDFDEAELDRAIAAYQHRDRRFGGVKK
ncbi:MAG: polyprenyl diphosphate synthase [Dysosmobacter sp.]